MEIENIIPPTIALNGEGSVLEAFGSRNIVHVGGAQSGGRFTISTVITPPDSGPPLHYHLHEDECFHVQEGRTAFFVDGKWQEAGPGAILFMPKGTVHTFKNVDNKPNRMLVITTPSGFETFFARCAGEFAKPGGPDMQRIVEISAEHGIHYVEA